MAITYQQADGIGRIIIDDGKANAISSPVIEEIERALDQAEADNAIVILTGNARLFSAGFDLNELGSGAESVRNLVYRGAQLCLRMLQFPLPIVAACSGHAYPMGAFLLMSSDYRIGATGDYNLGMNEVRINLTVPRFAVELARGRLHPAYFNRTVVTGEMFDPETAVIAGILDELVTPQALADAAQIKANDLKAMDFGHHHATKLRVRGPWIDAIQKGVEMELQT